MHFKTDPKEFSTYIIQYMLYMHRSIVPRDEKSSISKPKYYDLQIRKYYGIYQFFKSRQISGLEVVRHNMEVQRGESHLAINWLHWFESETSSWIKIMPENLLLQAYPTQGESGQFVMGPMIIFILVNQSLKSLSSSVHHNLFRNSTDKTKAEQIQDLNRIYQLMTMEIDDEIDDDVRTKPLQEFKNIPTLNLAIVIEIVLMLISEIFLPDENIDLFTHSKVKIFAIAYILSDHIRQLKVPGLEKIFILASSQILNELINVFDKKQGGFLRIFREYCCWKDVCWTAGGFIDYYDTAMKLMAAKLRCSNCTESFEDWDDFILHKGNENHWSETCNPKTRYQTLCKPNNERTVRSNTLKNAENTFQCVQCGKFFPNETLLLKHARNRILFERIDLCQSEPEFIYLSTAERDDNF